MSMFHNIFEIWEAVVENCDIFAPLILEFINIESPLKTRPWHDKWKIPSEKNVVVEESIILEGSTCKTVRMLVIMIVVLVAILNCMVFFKYFMALDQIF